MVGSAVAWDLNFARKGEFWWENILYLVNRILVKIRLQFLLYFNWHCDPQSDLQAPLRPSYQVPNLSWRSFLKPLQSIASHSLRYQSTAQAGSL